MIDTMQIDTKKIGKLKANGYFYEIIARCQELGTNCRSSSIGPQELATRMRASHNTGHRCLLFAV